MLFFVIPGASDDMCSPHHWRLLLALPDRIVQSGLNLERCEFLNRTSPESPQDLGRALYAKRIVIANGQSDQVGPIQL
jgi:hypothetical protein